MAIALKAPSCYIAPSTKNANSGNLLMKQIVTVIAFALLTASCDQLGGSSLDTDEDKAFYTIGFDMGSRLSPLSLSDSEISALKQGLEAALNGDDPEVDINLYAARLQSILASRMNGGAGGEANASVQEQKDKGMLFVAEYLENNPNAQQTPSGLVYEITQEGSGATPAATDIVEVHYTGTLLDGTVFDSSVERGETATFPLNRVIPGWTEGLQLVKEGGKIKLIIPAELAYGDQGAGAQIPGGATLVFEVELIKVNPEPKADLEIQGQQ
jgi:FKBP-type peptidyl-prolyl cis-trans isomerase FkpA